MTSGRHGRGCLLEDGSLEDLFAPLAEARRRRVLRRSPDGIVEAFVLGAIRSEISFGWCSAWLVVETIGYSYA
jgi:hypothetical protein